MYPKDGRRLADGTRVRVLDEGGDRLVPATITACVEVTAGGTTLLRYAVQRDDGAVIYPVSLWEMWEPTD